jgi:predicted peptidase
MKTVAFLIIVLIGSSSVFAQDLSLFQKKEFKTAAGKILPYRILFPENYDRSKKYPLVVFLHGVGERGTDNEKQLTHGARFFLSENARKNFPAIVIFPQCPESGYWSSVKIDTNKKPIEFDFDYSRPATDELSAVINMLKMTLKTESVDKKRVYIAGLSMGGFGTFEAVFRSSKMFAAVLPICGGGDIKHYDKRVKQIPFWVFHGADDAIVNVKYSREMVEKLKSIGVSVKYSEYPGVNHDSWNNAFAESDFLKWMFSNQRK